MRMMVMCIVCTWQLEEFLLAYFLFCDLELSLQVFKQAIEEYLTIGLIHCLLILCHLLHVSFHPRSFITRFHAKVCQHASADVLHYIFLGNVDTGILNDLIGNK